jgi:hypothetical protein
MGFIFDLYLYFISWIVFISFIYHYKAKKIGGCLFFSMTLLNGVYLLYKTSYYYLLFR